MFKDEEISWSCAINQVPRRLYMFFRITTNVDFPKSHVKLRHPSIDGAQPHNF